MEKVIITNTLRCMVALTIPMTGFSADVQTTLPPGSITMGGQASLRMDLCMKTLITSRELDTLIRPFREKTDNEPTGQGQPDNWRCDYWGKWFTALAWGYAHKPTAEHRNLMDRAVKELISTQGSDGNIGSFDGEKRLNGGYDVWGRQCVILGLTSYYDMTGDKAALDAACRVLDCLIDEVKQKNVRISDLGWGMWRGLAPSVIVESGALLYQRAGRQKYLDFSEGVVAEWNLPGKLAPNGLRLVDDALAGKSARDVGSPKGYEQLYCFIGICELYRASGNRRYLDAALALAKNIREEELFITGTGTAGECWFKGQSQQTQIVHHPAETCVTAHWMYFCWHLLRLTDDPAYADELERSLYNALMGALMPEGHWWGYFQSLMGERVPSYIQQTDTGLSCCVVSGSRALMLTPFWAVMQAKSGPVLNLYFPGRMEVKTASGAKASIEMETDYPREGTVIMTVKPARPENFTLALRIPAWSEATTLTVNGAPQPAKPGSYSRISRLWKDGDRVELRLDMRTRIQDAPDKNGQLALTRGPIVLALDERLVSPEKNAQVSVDRAAVSLGKTNLNPASAEKAGVWIAVDVPFLHDGKQRTLTLCDYSSAGNQWSSTNRFRTWLPQPLQLENVYNTGVTWKNLTHGGSKPQAPAMDVEKEQIPVPRASSSHEEGGWGIANLFASSNGENEKGYSSKPNTSDTAEEWLEFDLGADKPLGSIQLLPRRDMSGSGFPRDFKVQLAKQPGEFSTVATYTDCPAPDERGLKVNLYTVIGYPSARYVRIAVTRLGAPSSDEPNLHRLQFSRIRLLRP